MRTILLAILFSVLPVQATLTLVTRETFQGVGSLDAGTPGNLGTVVAGTFYKRAVGPRLTSDTTANSLGWSADTRSTVIVRHDVTTTATAAANIGTASVWYRIDSFANNGANKQNLTSVYVSNGNQLIFCIIDATTGNFWYNRNGLWVDTDSAVAVPLKQWFELRATWALVSGTTYNCDLSYRLTGSSTWVTIYTSPSSFNAGAAVNKFAGGKPNTSGSNGCGRCI